MLKLKNVWEKYKKRATLGSGIYGDIFEAKSKVNNEKFMVKEIKKIKLSNRNEFLKDIEEMKKIKCDNIVKLIECIETEKAFYIISELCISNLEEYLNSREKELSIEELKDFLIELNKGLKVMHENKIIHGNIKPSNILISLNKNNLNKVCFKISDLGLSKLYEENIISKRDTSQFISPECLKGKKISDKSDIWSLGILIYYLLFQKYPYNGTQYEIMKQIESNKQLNVVNDELLDDLLKRMLNPNVNERINWEGYFKHPFFNKNRIEKLEGLHYIKDKLQIQLRSCNLKNINSIHSHNDWVNSVSTFPSGNIISASADKSIIIYDIHFTILQNIQNAHDDSIGYVEIKMKIILLHVLLIKV